MPCVKIRVRELSVQFRIRSRNRKSYASQHIVSCDPINMVHVNLGAHDHSIIFLFFLLFPSTRPFLSDCLRPARHVSFLWYFIEKHV